MNIEPRTKRFLQGAVLVLVPAALLIPAIAFFTICPPAYAKIIFTALLAVFTASAALGLVRLFGCFTRQLDLVAIGTIVCSVIGLAVLAVIAWGIAIQPPW
jgi:hypothetical protein